MTVSADDVYIPPFQNLTWTRDSADRVLARGSLGARDADGRPLQVVVSAEPGAWRAAFDAGECIPLLPEALDVLPAMGHGADARRLVAALETTVSSIDPSDRALLATAAAAGI